MKTFIPRPSGLWFAAYRNPDIPPGKRCGLMISTGSRDITLSGGIRGVGAALIGWRFALPHRVIGNATRQWEW